jgi:hypothetical protein
MNFKKYLLLVFLIIISIRPIYSKILVYNFKWVKYDLKNADLAFFIIDEGIISYIERGAPSDSILNAFQNKIDAQQQYLYPGFIVPYLPIGLSEVDAVRASVDHSETGNFNPNVRSIVAYNMHSKIIPTIRANGVLYAQTSPKSGLISGSSSVVRLLGDYKQDVLVKEDDAIHLNWPSRYSSEGWWAEPGPISKNEKNKQAVISIDNFFAEALSYYKNGNVNLKEKNLKYEALKKVFSGESKLFIAASNVKDILDAIKFCRDFEIPKMVLVGGEEAWKIGEILKDNNIPVVINRLHRLPENSDENIFLPYELPKLLHEKGVKFSFNYAGDMEIMGSRNLPFIAGTAVAYGLPYEEALKAITINTAEILGVENKIGNIAVGKEASFFLSKGDVFDMKSNQISKVFIKGVEVDLDDNHQKKLYEKYK